MSGAAAVGCGALFGLLPVLALIGRLGLPDDPPGFVPVFGGPLIAAALGIAVFLIVLGYALTFHQLALAGMYAPAEDSSALRNAVEVRGPVTRTPFFPAVVTSIVIPMMSPSLSPTAAIWRQGQLVGVGLGVLCLLVLLGIRVLRIRRLRRTLVRVHRGGADVTDIDRAHAITATTTQASELHAATTVWALLGAAALGTVVHRTADVAPVLIVAGIWALGFAVLIALSMRSDAAAPKLREEFGYRLPTKASGNDNTWH
ncbi:hypothetical protein OG609_44630 (plasmid) [Streptomyces sp. NBC_01224]|uniref:hypothetical protein n=1 Tax=Streptomyces sp. NBC_01224 TaxID=2903783 RepID=UPI002E1563DB|nr:hypothetical protein OG609_44630 [Streptomyces sp. NBC_01224]